MAEHAGLKLEHFERALRRRAGGTELADAFAAHVEEVLQLVSHDRRVAVVWQRNQGPAFVRAAIEADGAVASRAPPDVVLPKAVNGISLELLVLRMADILQRRGSLELRQAIAEHALRALRWARECGSFTDVLHQLESPSVAGAP